MAKKVSSYNANKNLEFVTVEAYKLARTNITLSVIKDGCKKIVITSALENEGKTTTTCNIAAAFSKQMNCRVLLIDCDLRRPSVSKFFRLKNTPGVSNYLGGMCGLEDIIQKVQGTELSVICAGVVPPNPSELLSSEKFSEMLDILSERYDYILIDTPPIVTVVDAMSIIKIADGTVLVAFEDRSTYTALDKAVDSILRCDAKLLGFVLNGSKMSSSRHSYSYNYKGYGGISRYSSYAENGAEADK